MKLGPMLACLLALVGCSQNQAPVVDVPVRDRTAGTPMQTPRRAEHSSASAAVARPAPHKPPVLHRSEGDWRPDAYVVKKGDTLYGIALDHGQDYRDIASWNKLADPNVLTVGQQLRVRAPDGWKDSADVESGVITRPIATLAPIDSRPLDPPMEIGRAHV